MEKQMKRVRYNAASTVFHGQIVVSGGISSYTQNYLATKSVEAYDYYNNN